MKDADIVVLIRRIWKILYPCNEDRLKAFAILLNSLDVETLCIEEMVTYLRTSWASHKQIWGWNYFLVACMREVQRRGRDPLTLFRGLYG